MSIKWPSWSLVTVVLVLFSALIAELYRFQGFLLLDLLTPILIFIWLLIKLYKKEKIHYSPLLLPALLFVLIGWAALLIKNPELSTSDLVKSAFYGVRWISLFALSLVVFNQSPHEQKWTWKALVGFTLLLSLAGFVQLILVPDFTAFEAIGWDPHQGRLLSTWFDPNFVGGYLAFFTPLLLGYAWDQSKDRKWAIPLLAMIIIALALTLSRSAYLALLAGLFTFGMLKSKKLLFAGAAALLVLGLTLSPVRERFVSLLDNVESILVDNYTLPDASARLRYASWRTGWTLFMDSPLIGQGYNAYKFSAVEKGLIEDPDIHAASGSDSSLITILATTGILGFLPYLSLYALLLLTAWKNRHSTFSLGYFSGLTGLMVHSVFVNSLLFPLLLAPFWLSTGLFLEGKHEGPLRTGTSKRTMR